MKDTGLELPEALRNVFSKLPATTKGEYGKEKDSLWLQFYFGDGSDLRFLHVSIKGDNETAEILLNRLASQEGWELSHYLPQDEGT